MIEMEDEVIGVEYKMGEKNSQKETIIQPANSGLRDAYFAILKEMYAVQQDNFWMQDIVDIISLDCGISVDTAKDKFKQLARFKLLKYIYSSLSGHRYIVLVFSKNDENENKDVPAYIDSWFKFNRLIENQFPALVEDDLVRVRRSMNTPGQHQTPGLRDQKMELELESELEQWIILPGKDILKSEFKTLEKISERDVVQEFEENRKIKIQIQKENESDFDSSSTIKTLNSSGGLE